MSQRATTDQATLEACVKVDAVNSWLHRAAGFVDVARRR